MSKNENKRLMREKNDTCIKSYQLANTMFLNGEEFAAVIRKAMIVDDVNNKSEYSAVVEHPDRFELNSATAMVEHPRRSN